MEERQLYWLAGLLEGEGSFMKGNPSSPSQCKITLQMTDLDVVERVAALWGVTIQVRPPQETNHKYSYYICIKGRHAVSWMERLLPLMSSRRSEQVSNAIRSYIDNISKRVITDSDIARMRFLRHHGDTQKMIAADLGCSRSTVQKYLAFDRQQRLAVE